MEKLDKVVRALNCCLSDAECDFGCPYWAEGEAGEDSACELMKKDALRILKLWDDIHKDTWDCTHENHRLRRELKQVKGELRMKDELLEMADSSLKALRALREASEVIVHARWEFKDLSQIAPSCSNCGMLSIMWYPNCPYCRAKMENGRLPNG